MANRAGNNINKKISCHTMRHTCASNMAQNNASIISIQKILGHASIETTTTYIHTSLDSIKADHLRAIV
jgi:site-specific recombinase XerD